MSTSQNNRQKFLKSQGFSKLDVTCPSTLDLICDGNQLKATLYTPHFGHNCNLTHINLTKTEREQIAGKISEGVSFQKILDDIRNGIYSEESVGRLNFLDRRDLRNITRDFSLKEYVQLHQNDVIISIRLWVERLKFLKDEFSIIFYKEQSSDDLPNIFNTTDFALIFMTKFQEKQLKLFGADKICVDSTHGTTGYDFLLTTLMVVDEFGEGVPTAFLLSNRADTNVLTYIFNSIKEQTGDIKCKVFMSDDAPEFFNAWTNIMSKSENHPLCAWHIDRNWRKNLNKIKDDQAMKAKVYKYLRLLLQSTDPADFEDMLNFVLSELLACEDTAAFGQYFQTYYAGRCNLWAYCYRKGLGINTNMYLEALHRTLKHVYFQGKK
uniref:Uncharacterized protein LOC114346431 n=1 Tax=Diabrotica virgifera virgifera TaxID=50390 RepID=A0A6P7GTZ2_DIAVI